MISEEVLQVIVGGGVQNLLQVSDGVILIMGRTPTLDAKSVLFSLLAIGGMLETTSLELEFIVAVMMVV